MPLKLWLILIVALLIHGWITWRLGMGGLSISFTGMILGGTIAYVYAIWENRNDRF